MAPAKLAYLLIAALGWILFLAAAPHGWLFWTLLLGWWTASLVLGVCAMVEV